MSAQDIVAICLVGGIAICFVYLSLVSRKKNTDSKDTQKK